MWSTADLADILEQGLFHANRRFAREQAVYGLDALDELGMHPILVESLRAGGLGVHREIRYPADRYRRRGSDGERCDLVLTPEGRALASESRKLTLFEPTDAVDPEDAFWMEVKVVHQFTTEGPNGRYAPQLMSVVRGDLSKLAKDPAILHAGLLVVVFAADEEVAEHDLRIWYERCMDRTLPLAFPSMRMIPITNRLGNGVCALALGSVR